MARHKQPDELAGLNGSKEKNPQRYSGIVPKPAKPVGSPPRYFDKLQRVCWNEIKKNCHEDVLKNTDKIALEQAAILLAEHREILIGNVEEKKRWDEEVEGMSRVEISQGLDEGILQKKILYSFPAGKMAQLVGLLARFGMTPTDRQKINLEKPIEDDDDDEL